MPVEGGIPDRIKIWIPTCLRGNGVSQPRGCKGSTSAALAGDMPGVGLVLGKLAVDGVYVSEICCGARCIHSIQPG